MINEKRQVIIGFAMMSLFLSIPYLLGVKNELVFDDSLLLKDEFRQTYWNLSHLTQRFLSYGSFFWVEAIFGEGWWKQRVVNLIVHFATAIALFQFYRTLSAFIQDDAPLAHEEKPSVSANRDLVVLIAVAFYALNPVAVYAVAYLIQRSILLATLGVVLALWLFSRALISKQKKFFAFSLLAYMAALSAKEHALLAPLCVAPLYVFIRRPSTRQMLRTGLVGAVLTLLASSVFALVYGRILGTAFDEYSKAFLAQLEGFSPGITAHAWPLSIFNQMHLFIQYGWRWLLPIPEAMSIDLRPPFPLSFFSYPHLLGALAYLSLLCGGLWALLRWRDARALLGLAVLIAIILHGTEFATVWVQDPFVLYRSYLWAIAIPGLLIALLHGTPSKFLLIVGFFVATIFTVGSVERVLSLATPISAWGDAITKMPNDSRSVGRWRPYLNRGAEYMDAGMLEAAMNDFSAADALGDPGQFGQFNRGVALYQLKKHRLAIDAFDAAEKKGYADANLFYQRGLARFELKEMAKSHEDFDRAIKTGGLSEQLRRIAQARRGVLAVDLRDPAAAIKDLEEVITYFPGDIQIMVSLGVAHARIGDPQRAKQLLSESLQQVRSPVAYYGRALAAYRLQEKSVALAEIDAAIALDEKNPGFSALRDKIRALR